METFNGYTYFYQGKRLITVTKNNKTINYTYDVEGLIIKKEVVEYNTTTTTNYYYDNRKLIKEVIGNNVISYFYDNNNQLYGYKENNNVYFYIRDILGNIIGIIDDIGTLLSKFDYDAYGNIINQTGTIISNFRYKGYYYDTDLELYCLKTRFYNPVLLRFITSDSIEYLDSSGIIGLNLYAYCGYDPVNMIDEEGNFAISSTTFLIGALIGAIVGGVISVGVTAYEYIKDGEWDTNKFTYIGAVLGGAIAGAGLGIVSVLGCGAGAALFIGAPGFTIGNVSFCTGMAFITALSTSAIAGGLGYSTRVAIEKNEEWDFTNFTKAVLKNTLSGAISFGMGIYGGVFSGKIAFGPSRSITFGAGDNIVTALGLLLKIIICII
jgi:RHS repeat-associated protein